MNLRPIARSATGLFESNGTARNFQHTPQPEFSYDLEYLD